MTTVTTPAQPGITAILPYFGAKRTLAARIVAELGEHSAYWEPFCGSLAVLLAKPPAAMETVNDMYGEVVNLARVIRHADLGPALYRMLRRTILCEDLMREAAEHCKERGKKKPAGPASAPDLDRAYDFFVSSWAGRNGVTGTESYNQGFARRYTKSGGDSATRWARATDSIPAWRRRLRLATVWNIDGFTMLDNIEDERRVVIYIDPPYVAKGASYVYDFTPEDHIQLCQAASRFRRTRVVVSYYDHPLIRDYYAGWTLVQCPTVKSMVSAARRDENNAVKAPEILLINGPSLTDPDAITLPPAAPEEKGLFR